MILARSIWLVVVKCQLVTIIGCLTLNLMVSVSAAIALISQSRYSSTALNVSHMTHIHVHRILTFLPSPNSENPDYIIG